VGGAFWGGSRILEGVLRGIDVEGFEQKEDMQGRLSCIRIVTVAEMRGALFIEEPGVIVSQGENAPIND
jgi:hypothetical protein